MKLTEKQQRSVSRFPIRKQSSDHDGVLVWHLNDVARALLAEEKQDA